MATNSFRQDKGKNQLAQVIWDYMKREDKLHKVTTCKNVLRSLNSDLRQIIFAVGNHRIPMVPLSAF